MEQVYLTIRSDEGVQKVIVGAEPVTIGRHPQNLVVLTDIQASRYHCVIARAPEGGFMVRDLNSRNGTRLNGDLIHGVSPLRKGDLVSIGATEIRLVVGGETPAAAAPAPGAGKAQAARPAPLRKSAAKLPPLPPAVPPSGQRARPQPPPPPPPPPPLNEAPPMVGQGEEEEEIIDLAKYVPPACSKEDQFVTDVLAEAPQEGGVLAEFGAASGRQDDERFLPVLAESLPATPFEAEDIALLNARGQVVHPAAVDGQEKKRKVAGSGEAVGVLRSILLICCRSRATDVHVEPKAEDFQLRLRIDGIMIDIVRVTKAMGTRLLALVKVMCDIDMQFRDIVQEGHFSAVLPDRRVDYRISYVPSMMGQKLVIRVLDATNSPLHLPDLRLPMWMLEEVQRASQADQGMMLVVGPTGSGKTTTLYAALRDVGVEQRNVVTIEDPVEIEIPGATQVPVNDDKGNSFSALLRSMLRQDPDVIMVGEIRDAETARIAMQAAMTGHLVFSTVHAKDCVSAVFRLLDLGTEPYLVSSSLQIVVAQRLVRELCPYCKRPVRPTEVQIQKMSQVQVQPPREIFLPSGCPKCLKTGFAGRRAVFEMLTATSQLRDVILKSPTPGEIEKSVAGTRFVKLMQSGQQLVAEGVTSFEEIEKVAGR